MMYEYILHTLMYILITLAICYINNSLYLDAYYVCFVEYVELHWRWLGGLKKNHHFGKTER